MNSLKLKKLYFKKLDIVKNESLKSKKIILDELKQLTIKKHYKRNSKFI